MAPFLPGSARKQRAKPVAPVGAAAVAAVLLGVCGLPLAAWSQFNLEPKTENPVFVDESPAVGEGLTRAREHVNSGNPEQAVRTLQKILDEHGDGFVVSASDPDLFEPVRLRVHALLLESPSLMARYREAAAASARQMFDAGRIDDLVRTRLMTPEGLTAALRVARSRVLSGQFDGASLSLLEVINHPDLAAQAAAVAEVASLVARYEPNEGVRKRLGALAGGNGLPEVVALPRMESGGEPSLGRGSRAALPDDLVNQPMGTGVFADASLPINPLSFVGDDAALGQLPLYTRALRCWPALSERAVYFSNGSVVSGFDRVSMRRLWSVNAADALKLPVDEQDRGVSGSYVPAQNTWEEVVQPVVTAGSSMVVAVVGRDFDSTSSTEGAEYLAGFDAQTGAVRYAVALRDLDEQLTDCYARGPLVSDGRVVVVNLLKRQNQRRLLASLLVGVDATTGKRLWTRVVGSAGVLPFYRVSALTDSTVSGAGVVYRYDRLGVIGAYTIAEGRPLWVRRMSSRVVLEMPPPQNPWVVHQPVVTGAGVVVLSPDRDEVIVLDPVTGRVTARRKAAGLHHPDYPPDYVVATATHLAAVGPVQVGTVRLDQIENGTPKFSGRFGAPGKGGIRGRVTVAGDTLIVPTATGLTVINPDEPGKPLRTVGLDAPGSPLVLPEGLLVVDDARVHMYCPWAVAAAHLKEQIAASPADAGPAAELLKLAERASRADEMLPAADSALAALGKGAGGSGALQAEQRASVVSSLLRAVDRSIGVPVEQAGARLDGAGVEGALERAATAAQTPWDKVAVLLTRGSVREHQQRWAEAVEAYQTIVLDGSLGSASAPGAGSGSSAASVAVDRLSRVIKAGGRASYAVFDARFAQAQALLGANAGVEEVEAVAAQYPLAQGVPAMWLRAATLYGAGKTAQGQRAQARALERGVQAAERTGDADAAVVGELNGALARNLIDRGLLSAAADALARAEARFPGVALSFAGSPVSIAELKSTVLRDLAGARRWARVGTPRAGEGIVPQVIEGWVLMEPLIKPAAGSNPPFIVLHKGDERRTQVALFGLKRGQLAGEAAEGAAGALTEIWFSESGSEPWTLVRADSRGALFFVGEQNGGRLARVDAESGKVAWQTEPFGSLFPADPPERFGGPNGPQRASIGGELRMVSEIVIAADERTVCMVERAGRCAAVDADSGQSLWTARLPVTRIADATVSGGQLVAIGEFAQPQTDGKLDRLALFDARAGTQLAVTAAPISGVRYIRTTSRGDLIMGAGGTIVAVSAADLETAKASWTLKGHPAASAWEAWLLDDRLFLLGDDRSLWEVSAVSGAAPTKSIDTQNRLEARTAIAVWQPAGGAGVVAFATGRGMVLIDGKGGMVGTDVINATDGSVLPVVTEGGALLLVPGPARQGSAMFAESTPSGVWNLHRLETTGAQLLSTTPITFSSPPLRMAAIDGRIAVSTANGTVVFDSPAEGR